MTFAFRVRLLAVCLLLVGLAFVQDPGFLTADTKFDLAVDPAQFLARALHLWDGRGAFGQLQNQADGYFWPMGPFFAAGVALHLPGWVVQRLWLGLVLTVAFSGAARVSRALGVRSDLACILAGVAFALSPRMLSVTGSISIEAWPSALAPWVLLPLVIGSQRGSPRRAAALSGLAVAMVGGVNAAATFAVIPMGAIWLLTRTPGPRRRRLMLWWPVFVVLGTAWWLVPLALLGSYSPPFLDYIENASVTTFPTTLFDALRGTSDWVPYLSSSSRAGFDLISTPYLILDSGMVLLLGFAGLLHRRTPHRTFFALSVLAGVLMVTAGHIGATHGWFAGDLNRQLDHALAPLRNVHKFDPIIRLPLVVGLGFTIDRLVEIARDRRAEREEQEPDTSRVNALPLLVVAVIAIGGTAVPAALGRIAPTGSVMAVPEYWTQTATWLDDHAEGGTNLLVPGSSFATYVWGDPQDEPLQYLSRTPWAVRNAIPLAPPGNIRMLDEVESRLAQGSGSSALVSYLARAGVDHLVVRNDLARGDGVADPVLVHQAIAQSPGLVLTATFGPQVGGGARLDTNTGSTADRVLANGGLQATYPAVEVYSVPGSARVVGSSTLPTVVAGGPEDLLDLIRLGRIGDEPTVLATDEKGTPPAGSQVVLTDGLQARERSFGRIDDGYSPVLTPGDVRRTRNSARDYTLDTGDRWSSKARLDGASAVSASSSASDSIASGGAVLGELPYAALDHDADTEWVTAPFQSTSAWWRVTLASSLDGGTVELTGGASAPQNQVVRVRTAAGVGAPVRLGPDQVVDVPLPQGSTDWLQVEDASGSPGRPMALAGVDLPDVDVVRRIVMPSLPSSWGDPQSIVMRRNRDLRKGCVQVDVDVRCLGGTARGDEEQVGMSRAFSLNQVAAYTPSLTVVPQGGAHLDGLVLQDQPVTVSSSSVAVPDPRASPVAAIDGSYDTTWFASPLDIRPRLVLGFLTPQTLRSLRVTLDPNVAARTPTRIRLSWRDKQRTVDLDHGVAHFPPIRTDQLTLTVVGSTNASSLGFDGAAQPVGIGISELLLGGVPYLPLGLSADERTYPCGSGPDVTIDRTIYTTSVVASPRELASGIDVPANLCGVSQLSLPDGEVDVDVTSNPSFGADALVLERSDDGGTGVPATVDDGTTASLAWQASTVTRRTSIPAGTSVVAWRQNTNSGWRATSAGSSLTPVVIDGWQQGWMTPSSAGPVHADFAPDRTYRVALPAGLLGLLLFALGVAIACVRARRPRARPARGETTAELGDRGLPAVVLLAVAVTGAGLVVGWPGAVIAVLTLVGLRYASGRRRPVSDAMLATVVAAACLVAALGFAIRPWADASGWAGDQSWPAYVMVVPLVALLLGGPERWRRPRWPRRVRRADR